MILNMFLVFFICSLKLIMQIISNTFLIFKSLFYSPKIIPFTKRNKILLPLTWTFKIYKSTKRKLVMYLIIFTIFSNNANNLHYSNANYQQKYTNIFTTLNYRLELYYLFIIDNLGYRVYSKNISNNKKAKCYNGNINNNKILKYMQFNKSNSHFQNYITKLNQILDKDKPDILALSEANIYTSEHLDYLNKIDGYKIETNLMSKYIGFSRNAILIKNDINYTRRLDLEHPIICTIWIQIKNNSK